MKRFLNSVHATPTDKKDGDDRGVAVVTRRRLRPINLSGSKEIRQSRDTSEGSPAMAATCCAFEKRHEESPPAQRSPQFQAFLDSLEPQYPKRKKLIQNWATSHFNHVL